MAGKHVGSRFGRLSDEFIELCQQEYRAGENWPDDEAGEFTAPVRRLVARESIDADRLARAGAEVLVDREVKTFGDWMALCLGDLLSAITEDEREQKEMDPELRERLQYRAADALKVAANSPTASPLVDYTALFHELFAAADDAGEPQAERYLLRALAWESTHGEPEQTDQLLHALVSYWLEQGKTTRAIDILAALFARSPDDVMLYELGGYHLAEAGFKDLAAAVARRALALLADQGDEEDLAPAFQVTLEKLTEETPESEDDEAVEPPSAPENAERLLAALETPFDGGSEWQTESFCVGLVPELAELPTKRPLEDKDVDAYEELEVPETYRRATPKVGRNDPCPCGSGKKYKKCCGR